jgi:hypothetical protein
LIEGARTGLASSRYSWSFPVLTSDSYLFDAGWLFFAAWSVVIIFVGWTAFSRDLLPSRRLKQESESPDRARRSRPHLS